MTRRHIAAAMLVSLLFAIAVPAASAETAWQGFGKAGSWERGGFDGPFVYVESTTKQHPTVVRIQFKDRRRTKRTNAEWGIYCWSNFLQEWTRGSSGYRHMPFTISWDPPSWVDYCEVYGSAWHLDNGQLEVSVQARYP